MSDSVMNTYARLPVAFERGEGAWLWDQQGTRYLDALGGIAVCALGHAHPAVTEAIRDQAGKLVHTSNLYEIPLQRELADLVTGLAGMDRAFFCNSGAEANEAAIKLARLHGHRRGVELPHVVVAEGAFHGRTLATLTATGNRKVQAGFEPLVNGFVRVPFNDLDALSTVAANTPSAVAVLLEPIQGEGGIRVAEDAYLRGVRELCDRHGWLLMFDEIQCGMGRSGRFLACQHSGVQPDVVTLAKALANGFPIGVCMARGGAAELFQPGNHGSTFGGNPLACRAALATVRTLLEEQLIERAEALGARLLQGLSAALENSDAVVAVRGRGLMLGVEFDRPCRELVTRALAKGLLINVTAETVIRLLPPLTLTDEQADRIVDLIAELAAEFSAACA